MSSPSLVALAQRHYASFNARDLDAYADQMTTDVEVMVEDGFLTGRAAVKAYTARVLAAFPTMKLEVQRILAEGPDAVVAELRIRNAAAEEEERAPSDDWDLAGLTYQVIQVTHGKISAIRSCYVTHQDDRTDVPQLPRRDTAVQAITEQAALGRVVALVVRNAAEREVLAAVSRELGRLVDADETLLFRSDPDESLTLVAAWSATVASFPLGARRPLDGAIRALYERGNATAVPSPPQLGAATEGSEPGSQPALGVPIFVDGRAWGVVFASWVRPRPLMVGAEARMMRFAELASTALGNAQARAELEQVAHEQAALRRVAELVARGAAPDAVMAAVAREASALIGEAVTLMRYTGPTTLVTSAVCGGPGYVGWTLEYAAETLPDRVRRRAAPVRVDDYAVQRDRELAESLGMSAAVGVPITVEGQVWGMFKATSPERPLQPGTEDRLLQFAELVGAAISNADSRTKLQESRARVVATADETRRRVQRDVHDGAQQRLVQTVITLKLARRALADGDASAVGSLLDEALLHAERATSGLRDVVRGILPDALNQGGLRAGVESLVDGLPLAVRLDIEIGRLPTALETTAYFVIAEALTNVVKHARASHAEVSVTASGGHLTLEVRDDGVGGADTRAGSGLTGLFDRVHAGDGELEVTSPPARGTVLRARFPLGLADVSKLSPRPAPSAAPEPAAEPA